MKRRKAFRDIEKVAASKDKQHTFPGLTGDEKTRKRLTTKLCTNVLNNKPVEIPDGKSKADAKAWCAANMKGKPFLYALSSAVQQACTKDGKALSNKACRRAILEQAGPLATGVKLKLSRVVSNGAPFVTSTVKGRPLMPFIQSEGKSCRPAGKDAHMRDCHYELEFFNPEAAASRGIAPGPYLRVCPKKEGEPGALFAVKSPQEAKAIMDKHCACRKAGGSTESCATTYPSSPVAFGKAPKATNKLGLFGYGVKRK